MLILIKLITKIDRIYYTTVPLHLHCCLHFHVVLEEAAAERGLVVALARRGLDGRLHPVLSHVGGDDPCSPRCSSYPLSAPSSAASLWYQWHICFLFKISYIPCFNKDVNIDLIIMNEPTNSKKNRTDKMWT